MTFRAAVVAVTVALVEATSYAQSAEDDRAVEALMEEGVALRQRGDDEAALTRFREAFSRTRAPRAQAQVALAEQALGDWINADRDMRAALAVTNDPWIDRNRTALQGALQQISHRIGSVDVRVNVPGAELWIDGTRIGSLPLPAPARVAAGVVMLEVRADGYATLRRSVEVRGESLARETFNLVRVAGAEPNANASANNNSAANNNSTSVTGPTTGPSASGAASSRAFAPPIGAAVVLGVGGATLVSSAIFAAMRAGAIGNCRVDGNTLVCPSLLDAQRAESGRTYTTLTNITLIAGGALVVGGATWLIVSMATAPREAARARGVMVAPTMVASETVGASMFGRF
ncbi:MAG: PEGA domain-containing protein [Polyangiales bacterium]